VSIFEEIFMAKILFLNVPAHGHVNPSLPLVAELTRQGHRVTYLITESYRASVEAAGATFRPYATLRDDYFESQGLGGHVPQQVGLALITTAGEIMPELRQIAQEEQPDVILFDGMCPWGLLLARVLRLPAVTSLSLMALSPRLLLSLDGLRAVVPMLVKDFDKAMQSNRKAKALCKQVGILPMPFASILNAYGDLTFSYTSSYFQPFADSVDKSIRFVGWTLNTQASDTAFSLERVGERRLIYVSLGTVNNTDRAFFQTCIEALADSDAFVVMTTGNGIPPDSFGTLPENVAVYEWVPQIEVLKRAALFISHAGINSVHEALYLGVPLLLVPQQAEQTFTAKRVVELGAGMMLKRQQVTLEALKSHVQRLLREPCFRTVAQSIGDTLRKTGGMPRAVDEVEALLRRS
jgi:MGT family glycosyltransferase